MKTLKVKAGWPGVLIRLAGGRRWEFPPGEPVPMADDDAELFRKELRSGLLVEMEPVVSGGEPASAEPPSEPQPAEPQPPKPKRRARDTGDGA